MKFDLLKKKQLKTKREYQLGSILYKTANSICYTLSYPHTAVFHALKEDFQWTNSKGRSCDNKHTAVCRQTLYARVTFTVLSTPTQILQADVPLSELGACESESMYFLNWPSDVCIDSKYADLVHVWQLCYNQHENRHGVEEKHRLLVVGQVWCNQVPEKKG